MTGSAKGAQRSRAKHQRAASWIMALAHLHAWQEARVATHPARSLCQRRAARIAPGTALGGGAQASGACRLQPGAPAACRRQRGHLQQAGAAPFNGPETSLVPQACSGAQSALEPREWGLAACFMRMGCDGMPTYLPSALLTRARCCTVNTHNIMAHCKQRSMSLSPREADVGVAHPALPLPLPSPRRAASTALQGCAINRSPQWRKAVSPLLRTVPRPCPSPRPLVQPAQSCRNILCRLMPRMVRCSHSQQPQAALSPLI